MPTLNQLIRHGREEKRRTDRTRASDQCPQKQGVRPRVSTRTPKKPNSAPRKIAKVRLSNRHDIFAHIPGEGHNLQEHSMVLIRGGRVKDSPGVKSHCIRGVKDLLGIPDRRRGRSKYGAEKPKSIWMEDASGTCFSRSVEGTTTTLRPKIPFLSLFQPTGEFFYILLVWSEFSIAFQRWELQIDLEPMLEFSTIKWVSWSPSLRLVSLFRYQSRFPGSVNRSSIVKEHTKEWIEFVFHGRCKITDRRPT